MANDWLGLPSATTMLAVPLDGALQEYQTEAPVRELGRSDSPGSRVALMVEPEMVTSVPFSGMRFANKSFEGGSTSERRSPMSPTESFVLATWMWYSVP